jgi:hypothetical protein
VGFSTVLNRIVTRGVVAEGHIWGERILEFEDSYKSKSLQGLGVRGNRGALFIWLKKGGFQWFMFEKCLKCGGYGCMTGIKLQTPG